MDYRAPRHPSTGHIFPVISTWEMRWVPDGLSVGEDENEWPAASTVSFSPGTEPRVLHWIEFRVLQ